MMDKEIIELIKGLADGASSVVIWYFVLDVAKSLITAGGFIGIAWLVCRTIIGAIRLCSEEQEAIKAKDKAESALREAAYNSTLRRS